jgi:hypothetical protein
MSAPLPLLSRFRRLSAPAFFGVWFAVIGALGAWAVAQHVVPIPSAKIQVQAAGTQPVAWHILGAECGCSRSVAMDLVRRGPKPGWQEKVSLVGANPELEKQLTNAGFPVERTDAEELAKREGVQGAPWLVLFFPDGRTGYSGGYASARPGTPGTQNRDELLMATVARGESVKSLPSYGCATSRALRAQLDPVGLRY